MAHLENDVKVEALARHVDGRTEGPIDLATEFNEPEVTGYETGEIATENAYEILSPDTMLALDTEAGSDSTEAGEAIWFLSALADMEPIDLSSGSTGRETLETLEGAGVVPTAERNALIESAEEPVTGNSIGEQIGIGMVDPDHIEQAREYLEAN